MFSITKHRCFLKLCWTEVKRNIRRGNRQCIMATISTLSCDKLNEKKLKQKWVNGTFLQPKMYQSTAADKVELQKFMAVFPDIVKDLTTNENTFGLPDVTKWFFEVLQYNVPHGKKFRPLLLMLTYRMMAKEADQTPENIHLAMILGWCLEIFQAAFLIADDIIDESETRRGDPCWHKRDEVGMIAVNDCFLLTGGIYSIIRKYFHDKLYYANIQEIIQSSFLNTAIGQTMDYCTAQHNKINLELFTTERYRRICDWKTSGYSFILPVELAMCLAGCAAEVQQMKPILRDLGYLLQANDDFLDCFGDPTKTGKIGTDIQEGKCTWLAVAALRKASSEQQKIIEDCYGSPDPQKVAAIKDLYKEMQIPYEFAVFKQKCMGNIQTNIQQISGDAVLNLLFKIFEILRHRIA